MAQNSFESLETRRLLSAAVVGVKVHNYTLIVTGTKGDDAISVSQNSDTDLVVSSGGAPIYTATNPLIDAIKVNGKGGNDTIIIDSSVTNSTASIKDGNGADSITLDESEVGAVVTGNGSDSITTGSGGVFVRPGSGTDTLNLGSGDDVVHAGKGAETITESGSDLLFVGKGDTLTASGTDDTIFSSAGADTITSSGADTVYLSADNVMTANSSDTIYLGKDTASNVTANGATVNNGYPKGFAKLRAQDYRLTPL